MIDKSISNEYSDIISWIRALKTHASSIFLLADGRIAMTSLPKINFVMKYAITDKPVSGNFIYTLFDIPTISSVNTKFRKTKTEFDWESDHISENYSVIIKNDSSEPFKCERLMNENSRECLISKMYEPKSVDPKVLNLFVDEPDEIYTSMSEDMLHILRDTDELSYLQIDGNSLWFNRTLLGGMKNTLWAGGRILEERDETFTFKMKQREKGMCIYTIGRALSSQI